MLVFPWGMEWYVVVVTQHFVISEKDYFSVAYIKHCSFGLWMLLEREYNTVL